MKSDYNPALEENDCLTEVKMCSAEKMECHYSMCCRNWTWESEDLKFRNVKWESLIWPP